MRKIFLVLLAALLLLSACQRGSRRPSYDELDEKCMLLEEENAELRSELDVLLNESFDDLIHLYGYFDGSSSSYEEASESFFHLYSLFSPYY